MSPLIAICLVAVVVIVAGGIVMFARRS